MAQTQHDAAIISERPPECIGRVDRSPFRRRIYEKVRHGMGFLPPNGLTALGYAGLVALSAVTSAALPAPRTQRAKSDLLALASGLMLGAAFFHMLPEAIEQGSRMALALVPAGFFVLFALERTILVHTCEEPPDCHHHHSALGMTALVGLSVHTLFDGIALGAASAEGVGSTAFLAIAAHKVPSSLSLAAILRTEGKRGWTVFGFVTLFGLMVPLGVGLYMALEKVLGVARFAPVALAFSGGMFLYLAVADLLPHATRHGAGNRARQMLLLAVGLLGMFALSRVFPHGHAR
ncbi:MAG: ZIP family metal transporter [Myxococcaceae bacterium]